MMGFDGLEINVYAQYKGYQFDFMKVNATIKLVSKLVETGAFTMEEAVLVSTAMFNARKNLEIKP